MTLLLVSIIAVIIIAYFAVRIIMKKTGKSLTLVENKLQNKNNKLAIIGLILGIISIPFGFIGIIPILALVISGIALCQIKRRKEGAMIMAIIGLILGIIYTLAYMRHYGHI